MYQKTVLPNGVRIISLPMKERSSVAVGMMINAGGRLENDRVKGAAHFLEHIVFKGSRKFSCSQIKEMIEGVGGSLNAFTAEERTCYYAKVPAEHLRRTFNVLADMVLAPSIRQSDVDRERTVIMEELKMYHDLPHYYVLDLLDRLIWPGHPLGKSLIGTMDSITKMSAKDLHGFRQTHYGPGQIVIAVCGHLRHKDVVALTRRAFGTCRSRPPVESVAVDNRQQKSRAMFAPRTIEQMHLALGMSGFQQGHPDRYILNLLNIILGGNMSSRLFHEIREKRGLAYSIATGVKYLSDTGLFLVRAGVDGRKISETVDLIVKEFAKIKRRGVPPGELRRAKDYYIGQLRLGLEDTLDHMLWMAESIVSLGRVRLLKDIVDDVNKVRSRDLQRVAREVFKDSRLNLAVVGPVTNRQERALQGMMDFERLPPPD